MYRKDEMKPASPSLVCKQLKLAYPDIWSRVDAARRSRNWPNTFFLTLDAARRIIDKYPLPPLACSPSAAGMTEDDVRHNLTTRLCMAAAWRATKGRYRFDPDLLRTVLDARDDEKLPVQLLAQLPEWSLLIETGKFDMDGYPREWVTVTLTSSNGRPAILIDSGLKFAAIIPLSTQSIGEALAYHVKHCAVELSPPAREGYTELLRRGLLLSTYICAVNADLSPDGVRPIQPKVVKTKRGVRVLPAKTVRCWEVGTREGAKIRRVLAMASQAKAAMSDSARHRPRPHIRRAHSHKYWVGSKSDPGGQRLVHKWISVTYVNAESPDDLVETTHAVQDEEVTEKG